MMTRRQGGNNAAAADQVHARLTDVASLLNELHAQVLALTENRQLRDFLHEEQTLVVRTETLLTQIRYVREQEITRSWPAISRRWVLPLVFALASAGGGRFWLRVGDAGMACETLRSPADLADLVARRLATMAPTERGQFDALTKRPPG